VNRALYVPVRAARETSCSIPEEFAAGTGVLLFLFVVDDGREYDEKYKKMFIKIFCFFDTRKCIFSDGGGKKNTILMTDANMEIYNIVLAAGDTVTMGTGYVL